MDFEPNEAANVVAGGEAGEYLFLMLMGSPHKIACHAKVQRSLFSACEQVNVEQINSPVSLLDSGSAGFARVPE